MLTPPIITRVKLFEQALRAATIEYRSTSPTEAQQTYSEVSDTVVATVLSAPLAYICSKEVLSDLIITLSKKTEDREFVAAVAIHFVATAKDYDIHRDTIVEELSCALPVDEANSMNELSQSIPGMVGRLFGTSFFTSMSNQTSAQKFKELVSKSNFLLGIFLIALYGRAIVLKATTK